MSSSPWRRAEGKCCQVFGVVIDELPQSVRFDGHALERRVFLEVGAREDTPVDYDFFKTSRRDIWTSNF